MPGTRPQRARHPPPTRLGHDRPRSGRNRDGRGLRCCVGVPAHGVVGGVLVGPGRARSASDRVIRSLGTPPGPIRRRRTCLSHQIRGVARSICAPCSRTSGDAASQYNRPRGNGAQYRIRFQPPRGCVASMTNQVSSGRGTVTCTASGCSPAMMCADASGVLSSPRHMITTTLYTASTERNCNHVSSPLTVAPMLTPGVIRRDSSLDHRTTVMTNPAVPSTAPRIARATDMPLSVEARS